MFGVPARGVAVVLAMAVGLGVHAAPVGSVSPDSSGVRLIAHRVPAPVAPELVRAGPAPGPHGGGGDSGDGAASKPKSAPKPDGGSSGGSGPGPAKAKPKTDGGGSGGTPDSAPKPAATPPSGVAGNASAPVSSGRQKAPASAGAAPTPGANAPPGRRPVAANPNGSVDPLSPVVGKYRTPEQQGGGLPSQGANSRAPLVDPTLPATLSGSTPLEPDAETTAVLHGVQASRPAQLREQPLNFGTTPVDRNQLSTLVTGEGGDLAKVNSSLRELAGPNPSVTSTPMLLRDGNGRLGAASLFEVKGTDGQTYLMDGQGAHYTSFDDYQKNNTFPAGWTITHRANLGNPDGDPNQLVTSSSRAPDAWESFKDSARWITRPTRDALEAVAHEDWNPRGKNLAKAALGIGHSLVAAGDGVNDWVGRWRHGRGVNPFTDPEARVDLVKASGGAATALGLAAGPVGAAGSKGLATGLGVAGAVASVPGVAGQGADLARNWGHLTPGQRVGGSAELAASIGLAAAPAFAGKLAPKGERLPSDAAGPESGSAATSGGAHAQGASEPGGAGSASGQTGSLANGPAAPGHGTVKPPNLVAGSPAGAAVPEELTRVGRWMSQPEYDAMRRTGMVQEGSGGTTYVANPADPEAYSKQAAPGSLYVEFDVPTSSLSPAGGAGWGQILGPNHWKSIRRHKMGRDLPPLPSASNVKVMRSK